MVFAAVAVLFLSAVLNNVPAASAAPLASAPGALPRPFLDWIARSSATLDNWYDPGTGLFRTTGWWNSAHALEAELTASHLLGDDRGARRAATTYAAHQASRFLNNYYDDEGWWGLTWVVAYDDTGDARYLRTAQGIFDDLTGGWDEKTCGGGIWWSKERKYKNAIANELFTALGAELAVHTTGADSARYRDWSLRGWRWVLDSGMLDSRRLFNDGLDDMCHNNGQTAWTYNQGVVLTAAVELFRVTGDQEYLRTARRLANAAIAALSGPDGILREPCETEGCGADGPQFKGIFIQSLARLEAVSPDLGRSAFIERNAVSIWTHDRGPGDQLGLRWSGPFDSGDAARQSSALACLNAAAQLA